MRCKRSHKSMQVFMVTAMALGILLWARLKLVTNVPRRAYAEPPITAPRGTGEREASVNPEQREAGEPGEASGR